MEGRAGAEVERHVRGVDCQDAWREAEDAVSGKGVQSI